MMSLSSLSEAHELLSILWVVWGVVVFVAIVIWTTLPHRQQLLDQRSMIPLRDDP